jgi:hypothetical protein
MVGMHEALGSIPRMRKGKKRNALVKSWNLSNGSYKDKKVCIATE